MILTKLKAKNQITIPNEIVKKLKLSRNAVFQVNSTGSTITLMPVDVVPRYTEEELDTLNTIVEKEKKSAKAIRGGRDFNTYLDSLV